MLLKLKDVSKAFFGVKVLDRISFELRAGEVHTLIGENGAGKTTLANVIAGVYQADSGEIWLDGQLVQIRSPYYARKLGISIIYQEPLLVPDMTVAENIFMTGKPALFGIFPHFRAMKRQAKQLLRRLGCSLHPDTLVRYLSPPERYMVAIAQALSQRPKILIMDEPSDHLTHGERQRLFDLIRECKEQGIGIIYITHRINEISAICDRVTVLRDGKHVITCSAKGLTEEEIIRLMLGREVAQMFPLINTRIGDELLRVEQLTRLPWFENVNFTLHAGEIIGLAGIVGAGRTELARTIFGQSRKDFGLIFRRKKQVDVKHPYQAVKEQLGYVSENRMDSGLIMEMSVTENMTIASLDKINRYTFLQKGDERNLVLDKILDLDIKIYHPDQEIKYLSGGNQQKVILGRWLTADSEVYLLDEPTRGIDVGARAEVYVWIHELAKQGKGIILISNDIQELMGLCNRILVMRRGKIVVDKQRSETSEEEIASLIS